MALQLWETAKEAIEADPCLAPPTFFTVLAALFAALFAAYYIFSSLFGSSSDDHRHADWDFDDEYLPSLRPPVQLDEITEEEQLPPLRPPVQLGEITEEELKAYDGSDLEKPLLMAIKGQIYDVSKSRMYYGPGAPYALYAGKDASRAVVNLSFKEKDLTGDTSGLGKFDLEVLQYWEEKFMSNYVKVGTIKKTVPVTEGGKREMLGSCNSEEMATQICSQISSIFAKPTHPYPSPLHLLLTELSTVASLNGRVFLYGVGREGLMLKALCMRLAHLGLSAHLVFDMTTPPITAGDLLIASAGPGGFSTVDAICAVARENGGRVVVITAQPESGSCVKHANAVAYVAAQTMAYDEGEVKERALLPMGSLYEGALFVLFEMLVYKLGEALGQSPEAVRSRHTNLE